MGGHGLYSTVGDYMKFIRMILNGGEGEHGRVLTPEMVEMMGQNGLGDMKIKSLPGVIEEPPTMRSSSPECQSRGDTPS